MTREEFLGALAAIVVTVLFRLVDRWLPPLAHAGARSTRPTAGAGTPSPSLVVVSENEPAAPIEGHPPETPSPDHDLPAPTEDDGPEVRSPDAGLPAPTEDDVEPTHIDEWDLPPPSS